MVPSNVVRVKIVQGRFSKLPEYGLLCDCVALVWGFLHIFSSKGKQGVGIVNAWLGAEVSTLSEEGNEVI